MASAEYYRRSFAIDNIVIISCEYKPYQPATYYSHLSLSCDFDNATMCDMTNGDQFTTPTFNFTTVTGDTVPNRDLGPVRDHTNNSTTGGFLYWNRQLPFTSQDFGRVQPSITILQNLGMCISFAYYAKSTAVNKNGTLLSVSSGGCYGKQIWSLNLDDSQGWQTVVVSLPAFACAETFYFSVVQSNPIPVSVAFDDIEIDQCDTFISTTTTTTASTITTPTTASTQFVTTTLNSTLSTLTETLSMITAKTSQSTRLISTTTMTTMSTTTNHSRRLISCYGFPMLLLLLSQLK
jgi:hypothetical protein